MGPAGKGPLGNPVFELDFDQNRGFSFDHEPGFIGPMPATASRLPWLSVIIALVSVALALYALSRSTRSHGPYLAREERRRDLEAGIGDGGAFDLLSAHRNFWGQFHLTGEEGEKQQQQQQQHSHDAEAAETPQATKAESVASPSQDVDGAPTPGGPLPTPHDAPPPPMPVPGQGAGTDEEGEEEEEEGEDAPVGMCAAAAAELVQCSIKSGGWPGQVREDGSRAGRGFLPARPTPPGLQREVTPGVFNFSNFLTFRVEQLHDF